MKKIFLGIILCVLAYFVQAQPGTGLTGLVVEKYYISNATDASNSNGVLPVGSYTYRFYIKMKPGYKFFSAYGNANHNLKFHTSTSFYNDESYGVKDPSALTSVNNCKKNCVMLDSWLTIANAPASKLGVLKTDDVDGSILSSAAAGILANNDSRFGISPRTEDGLATGSQATVANIGFNNADSVFYQTNGYNDFTLNNGSWYSFGGVAGYGANNMVLIAQITTDGILNYQLNVQLLDASSNGEKYVFSNADAGNGEYLATFLTGTLNQAPSISITSPTNKFHAITGDVVAINATATSVSSTISQVEFFVDGVSAGVDNTSPYSVNYTGVNGTHILTAVATDADGLTKTSVNDTLYVAANQAPSVTITAPSNGASYITGDVVSIAATASDVDGTVANVEFFVDGVSVGVDNSSPFTSSYTSTLGSHTITAVATDDRGAKTTSSSVSISAVNNVPPTVSITSPANNALYTFPATVTFNATASDADGSVAKVEFFVNGVKVDEDATIPYSYNWTSVIGDNSVITAVATDNRGATTTSAPITITIADPNALPYAITKLVEKCNASSAFCMTLATAPTTSVSNCIGYDFTVNFDKTKIYPTGTITINSDLINPTYVTYMTNIVDATSSMNVTVYFNGNAPLGTTFNGIGNLLCIDFNKLGAFGSIDTATVSVTNLIESYKTGTGAKGVQAGKFITYKDSTFVGKLAYWSNNAPIQYDVANPNNHLITNVYGSDISCNTNSYSVNPDLTGAFNYNINKGAAVSINRDILNTTDVHSLVGAFDAQRVALVNINNNSSFTPNVYQIIAMDVNMDGVISAGDASQIMQRAVLNIPEFSQVWNASNGKPSKDWLFIDTATVTTAAYHISSTYPNDDNVGFSKHRVPQIPSCLPVPVTSGSCPTISSEKFMGILLGDVDASYASAANSGFLKSTQITKNDVVIDLGNAIYNNGTARIPVSLNYDSVAVALDLDVIVNDQVITHLDSVSNPSKYTLSSNYIAGSKTISIAAFSTNQILPHTNVIYLNIKTNGTLTSSDFTQSLTQINGKSANLIVSTTTGVKNIENEQLVSVYPNPASSVLNVLVSEQSNVELMDLNGNIVYVKTVVNANQKSEINIQDLASGIYTLKIFNDKFVTVKKVVVKK